MRRKEWMRIFGWLVCGALALPGAASQAQNATRLDDPNLAARVNGAPVHLFTLDALWRLAVLRDPKTTRAVILESIIANRLLALSTHSTFKEYDLHASRRVAFERDVALDDQLVSHLRTLYGKEIETALKALPGGSLHGLVKEQGKLDSAEMDQVFGVPGRMLLEFTLNPEQQAGAKRLILLRTSLAAGQGDAISMFDVYRRQNVQGRVELFNRNIEFIRQQAQIKLASLFVIDWAKQRFGAAAVNDLRLAISDQDDVKALMELHGIGSDVDAESKLLNKLAKEVNQAEIGAYYQAHKEEFKRIIRVKAHHIRVTDEALARQLSAQLGTAKTDEFSKLARKHSTAPDAKTGGDLGWIIHEGKLNWLSELAFIQEPGQVSPPFRAAVGPNEAAYWEIVLVDKREEGYQAQNSETVRYQAGVAIAHDKGVSQFKALRERLVSGAKLEVNRAALNGTGPNAPTPPRAKDKP